MVHNHKPLTNYKFLNKTKHSEYSKIITKSNTYLPSYTFIANLLLRVTKSYHYYKNIEIIRTLNIFGGPLEDNIVHQCSPPKKKSWASLI